MLLAWANAAAGQDGDVEDSSEEEESSEPVERAADSGLVGGGSAWTAEQIKALANRLGAESDAVRVEAFEALTHLPASAIPAIEQRIDQINRREHVRTITANHELRGFREHAGNWEEDPDFDITNGVLGHLAQRRTTSSVRMAERVALLKALENLGTHEAGMLIVQLTMYDDGVWRTERRRTTRRMGPNIMSTLVAARKVRRQAIRRWVRRTLEYFEINDPGDAVNFVDDRHLAPLLRAYGDVRDMDAMGVIVSYLGHERRSVREAARWATREFGRNAVWQIRREYHNKTRNRADNSRSWEETLADLETFLDQQRMAPVQDDLNAGVAALQAGDLEEMKTRFEWVLVHMPDAPRLSDMAPGYAALAERRIEQSDQAGAIWAYHRALRLSPGHADATKWQAQLAFIEAEQARAQGIVDLGTYRRVLELDPEHEGATEAVELHTGVAADRAVQRKRLWGSAGGGVLVLLAGAFLFVRRRRPDGVVQDADDDGTPEGDAADTAPDGVSDARPRRRRRPPRRVDVEITHATTPTLAEPEPAEKKAALLPAIFSADEFDKLEHLAAYEDIESLYDTLPS